MGVGFKLTTAVGINQSHLSRWLVFLSMFTEKTQNFYLSLTSQILSNLASFFKNLHFKMAQIKAPEEKQVGLEYIREVCIAPKSCI